MFSIMDLPGGLVNDFLRYSHYTERVQVEPLRDVSLGGHGDSYYEYLLKSYLQTNQTEAKFLQEWTEAISQAQERLLFETKGGLKYLAKLRAGYHAHEWDHLGCFLPGTE